MMDNFDLRLQQWIRYELAARKIQRCYRQWRMHFSLYRRIKLNGTKRLNRSYDLSDKKGNYDNTRQYFDDFQSVLKQTAGFENKCAMWMRVIDLKRMYPERSTDILLRSLIESQGDLSRAQVILGSENFIFQNNQPLPTSVRSIFTPHIGPFEQQSSRYDVKFTKLLLVSANRYGSAVSNDEVAVASDTVGRNIDLIRSLRSHYVQLQKQELMEAFMKVVNKAYFDPLSIKPRPTTAGNARSQSSKTVK